MPRKKNTSSPATGTPPVATPITAVVIVDTPTIDIGLPARATEVPPVGTEAEWRAVSATVGGTDCGTFVEEPLVVGSDPLGVAILTGDHTGLVPSLGHPDTYPGSIDRNAEVTYTNTVGGLSTGDRVSSGVLYDFSSPGEDGDLFMVSATEEVACGTFTATEDLTRTDPRLAPLGDAIRSAREVAGVTMGEVARAIGREVTWVSDVERGRVFPDVFETQSFMAAIGQTDGGSMWAEWCKVSWMGHPPDDDMEVVAELAVLRSTAGLTAACLANPEATAAIYRAVVAGSVRVAEWSGPTLVAIGTGQTVGRVYPMAESGWVGRVGNDTVEFDFEGEARGWVESQAKGWSVVAAPKGRK